MKVHQRYTYTGLFAGAFFLIALLVNAQNIFDITYPIPELGNCGSQSACKTFCDDPANEAACVSFAEAHGFMQKKKIDTLRNGGPGGCTTQGSCKTYCDAEEHHEECVSFAQKHGLISKDDKEKFDQSQKIKEQIKTKGGPGGCTSPQECRTYCEDQAHIEECISFGVEHGFMSKEEAEKVRESLQAGKGFGEEENKDFGTGPGGCQGDACKTYCADESHFEECISFAEQKGFMSHEEARQAREFHNTEGPGGCRKEACKEYCADPAHAEECTQFAADHGFISKDEAERAKNFMKLNETAGPGGCKGVECRAYCESPEHREECFNFAKQNGLISREEEQNFENQKKLEQSVEQGGPGGCRGSEKCASYCQDPNHTEECLNFAASRGAINHDEARTKLEEFRTHMDAFQGMRYQFQQQGEGPGRPFDQDGEGKPRPPMDFYQNRPGQPREPGEMPRNFQPRESFKPGEQPSQDRSFVPNGRPFDDGQFRSEGMPFRDEKQGAPQPGQGGNDFGAPPPRQGFGGPFPGSENSNFQPQSGTFPMPNGGGVPPGPSGDSKQSFPVPQPGPTAPTVPMPPPPPAGASIIDILFTPLLLLLGQR